MYCTNCGKEIDNKAVLCPHCHCGVPQKNYSEDSGGIGWGLLGFFVPIAGLILFLIWKDSKPKTSYDAGIGALIGVCALVSFYVLYFLFLMSFIFFLPF